jgi:hypothetical protein
MDAPSSFELEVLGWVADDYEAPHTIAADIARELKRPVSEAQVRAALLALAQKGMVQAYVYEPSSQRYRPISHGEAEAAKEPWFMTAATGASN